jgi:hypothetical protein
VGGFRVGVVRVYAFVGYIGGVHVNYGYNVSSVGSPMDWVHLNGATRGRVADKNVDGGRRGSPMDFASPNEAWIGPLGRG